MQSLARFLAFLGMFLIAGIASAQGYPSKPVRLLVPFPPGGSTDMVARMISPGRNRVSLDFLSEESGRAC